MTDATPRIPPVPASLLAPLVQAAGELVRGSEAQETPPALRPLLGFDRRGFGSEAARRQLLRAVETDADFRTRVFEAFTARPEVQTVLAGWSAETALDVVDEAAARDDLALLASALYAARPDGWEFGLGVAVAWVRHDLAAKAEEDERALLRDRLDRLDEARRRAESDVERVTAEADRLAGELRTERASRREREASAERTAEEARREVERVSRELAEARRALERGDERLAREAERAAGLDRELRDARAAVTEMRSRPEPAPPPAPPVTPEEAALLERAAAVARRLVERGAGPDPGARGAPSSPAPESPLPEPQPQPPTPARPPLTRRLRVPVPPGLVGASVDGLRAAVQGEPAPIFVVDGYNVSMLAWGSEPPDVQRQRLCALLERLHVRWNVMVTVVFDGADRETTRAARRSGVRVVFSPAGVEADEVVVRAIAELPFEVPAVAVSSDHWVRDHAAAEGALVVASDIFLDFLRRAG